MIPSEEKVLFNLLEERTAKLEAKVIGPLPKNDSYVEVIPELAKLGSKLGDALSTRDRMMMVMKRLDELERYLDPSYGESSSVSEAMMIELIESQENTLRNYNDSLNILHAKKSVLDSQSIAGTVEMTDDLLKVSSQINDTEEGAKDQAAQIAQLLHKYNAIICTLTETLVKMDDKVTKAEMKYSKKKSNED